MTYGNYTKEQFEFGQAVLKAQSSVTSFFAKIDYFNGLDLEDISIKFNIVPATVKKYIEKDVKKIYEDTKGYIDIYREGFEHTKYHDLKKDCERVHDLIKHYYNDDFTLKEEYISADTFENNKEVLKYFMTNKGGEVDVINFTYLILLLLSKLSKEEQTIFTSNKRNEKFRADAHQASLLFQYLCRRAYSMPYKNNKSKIKLSNNTIYKDVFFTYDVLNRSCRILESINLLTVDRTNAGTIYTINYDTVSNNWKEAEKYYKNNN